MPQELKTAVGIFNEPEDTESAIKALRKSGFDTKKFSIVSGVVAGWIISSLALNGPLANIVIPKANIHQYENALRVNKVILIVRGTLPEVENAADILKVHKAEYATYHLDKGDNPLELSY